MKPKFSLILMASAFLVAGCETVDSLRERAMQDNPPHVRVFAADERTAFAAARAALDPMGYRFTHGGPAQGHMEALSGILPGDAGENARQISLVAEFRAVDGGTEVSVTMREIVEDTSAHLGTATTTALRDTPLYEVFFHGIQDKLGSAPP